MSSAPAAVSDRVAVYVDGFNLYFGLKSKGWRDLYWLDVQALGESLLKPNQVLNEVRYFTARIAGPPSKQRRQSVYLEALAATGGCSMYYGRYQDATRACVHCGRPNVVPNEKMTDVNIAVEMLTDAFEDRFDTALLVSGDSDLTGPVARIRDLFPKKRVVVAFPPDRVSKQLQGAASAHVHISRQRLSSSQLPDPVVKPDGFALQRPARWT